MFIRFTSVTFFTLLLSLPAAGIELPASSDSPLAAAALQMKLKNYSSAATLAMSSPESGRRDLLTGIAALKYKKYDEASKLLAKAVKNFPLLADYALFYQAESDSRADRKTEALAALKIPDLKTKTSDVQVK